MTQFTVHIRKVDHDEFTAYEWGTIGPDGTVSTTNTGREKFGPLDEYVERVLPEEYTDSALSPEVLAFWMERGRSYGSHAHRIKATFAHPLLERHLVYPEFDLLAIVTALEQPDAACRAIHELVQRDPFEEQDAASGDREATARVSFGLPSETDTRPVLSATMGTIFERLAAMDPIRVPDNVFSDSYHFRVTKFTRPIANIRISRQALDAPIEESPAEVAEEWHVTEE